jgi:hypothetical protein
MKTMKTTKEAKKWLKLVIAAAIAGISLSGCGGGGGYVPIYSGGYSGGYISDDYSPITDAIEAQTRAIERQTENYNNSIDLNPPGAAHMQVPRSGL